MKRVFILSILIYSGALIFSCQNSASEEPAGPGGWLKGDSQEKFNTIANQLRGFDKAMAETGYRYVELYWAGKDRNWGYAEYQADKIRTAIEQGLERRPKRAESAKAFLDHSLPALEEAITKKDTALFEARFGMLTTACNSCHIAEKVSFVTVKFPESRISPVEFQE